MPEPAYHPVTRGLRTAWLSRKRADHRLRKLRVKAPNRQWIAGATTAVVMIAAAFVAVVEVWVGVYLAASWIVGAA